MPEYNKRQDGDIIFGRNAIAEALRANRPIDSLLVASGERTGSINHIVALCREKGITVKEVSPTKLDYLASGSGNHQGLAAYIAAYEYVKVEDILENAEKKGEAPFIVILDEIEDPHNLGAIIRTAEASGVHGIIIPKRRTATLTGAVSKASAGALEYVPVAKVSNLATVIDELKKKNIWIYGADMSGENFKETNFDGGAALVIGNEASGISRLIKEKCDVMVSIPMKGRINSLNAAVAAGILMSEISCRRNKNV
ncbi:MAG: 23S rRNA (guanosine(2251)-2'-O)-methyltransferase RlmB [Acutalibacteraceae bacterium]